MINLKDYIKTKVVKIDVDGVIRDMLGALCKLYFTFDPNVNRDFIRNYEVNVSFPLIKSEIGIEAHDYFFKEHSDDVNFNMAVPFNGAKEAIDKLKKAGYKIVIVTKQTSPKSKINTIKFLTHYGIYYDDLCFTGDKWLIESDFMIDDNPEFLENKVDDTPLDNRFIIDAPYNRFYTDFKRFDSLMDAVDYIIETYGFGNEDKENNNHDRG